MARIRRTRSFVGLLGFVPLFAALFPFGPHPEVDLARDERERRAFVRSGTLPT